MSGAAMDAGSSPVPGQTQLKAERFRVRAGQGDEQGGRSAARRGKCLTQALQTILRREQQEQVRRLGQDGG